MSVSHFVQPSIHFTISLLLVKQEAAFLSLIIECLLSKTCHFVCVSINCYDASICVWVRTWGNTSDYFLCVFPSRPVAHDFTTTFFLSPFYVSHYFLWLEHRDSSVFSRNISHCLLRIDRCKNAHTFGSTEDSFRTVTPMEKHVNAKAADCKALHAHKRFSIPRLLVIFPWKITIFPALGGRWQG